MTTITFLPRATATQDENEELESSTSCSLDNDNKDDNSYHWKFLLAKTSRSRRCCDVAHPMFLNGTSAIHVLRWILQLGFTLHHTPPGKETTDLLNPDMSVRTSVAGRRGPLSCGPTRADNQMKTQLLTIHEHHHNFRQQRDFRTTKKNVSQHGRKMAHWRQRIQHLAQLAYVN